jgi:hypothetical protein
MSTLTCFYTSFYFFMKEKGEGKICAISVGQKVDFFMWDRFRFWVAFVWQSEKPRFLCGEKHVFSFFWKSLDFWGFEGKSTMVLQYLEHFRLNKHCLVYYIAIFIIVYIKITILIIYYWVLFNSNSIISKLSR